MDMEKTDIVNGRFCIVCEAYCLECTVNLSYNNDTVIIEIYNINKK